MNERELPEDLAELERTLRERAPSTPRAALKLLVLANLERERTAEQRFTFAAAAAIALFTWGVHELVPDGEPLSRVSDSVAERPVLAELGLGPEEWAHLEFAHQFARIPRIAPPVGGQSAGYAGEEGG